MPKNLEPRSVLFLDGIRYSTELVDLAFRRLERNLEIIANHKADEGDLGFLIVEAISDAWAFVDSYHRLRGLIQQLPGLKQKQPKLQIFLRQSVQIDDLRNYIQHLRTIIDEFVETKMPLWGSVSWTRRDPETGIQENHIIIPGTYFNDCRVTGCVFDSHIGEFIEKLVLEVGLKRVDLAELHNGVERFWKWFEEHLKPTFENDECNSADAHIKLEVRPVEGQAPKGAP